MIQTESDSSHHHNYIHALLLPRSLGYIPILKVAEVVRSLEAVGKTSAWLKALFRPNRTLLVIDMQVNSMRMAMITMMTTFGLWGEIQLLRMISSLAL